MELSENEKALYAELAVQLAFRMCDSSYFTEGRLSRQERPDFLGCVIQPGATSCLEGGCGVLKGMGALQPLNMDLSPRKEEPTFAPCYRLKFGVVGLREHLAGVLPLSSPPLSEVIEAFLALICDYNYGIHSRRQAFAVPPDFERIFELFASGSYVERVGDEVKWTDKIGPEMRAAYQWNEDLVSWWEVNDAEDEEMWRTMPPRFREAFFSGGPVGIRTCMLVSQFWNGREWEGINPDGGTIEIGGEYKMFTGGQLRVAQYLEKKFRESEG